MKTTPIHPSVVLWFSRFPASSFYNLVYHLIYLFTTNNHDTLQDIETKKIVNDELDEKKIALVSLQPFMVRAFDRVLDGQELDFTYSTDSNMIIDSQTGSKWNFEGMAVEGSMKGKQLERLPFDQGFWFEWVAFHPKTALYQS